MTTEAAKVAAMIRKELKKNGIKASVRKRSYDSVYVDLEDLSPSTLNKVAEYCDQFQMGHFNGMEDIYEYSSRRTDIPQVKFVIVRHSFSRTVMSNYFDKIKTTHSELEEFETWDYEDAEHQFCKSICMNVAQYVWREMQDDKEFWRSRKPRVRAA